MVVRGKSLDERMDEMLSQVESCGGQIEILDTMLDIINAQIGALERAPGNISETATVEEAYTRGVQDGAKIVLKMIIEKGEE
jgi:prefoldin subunit 5